MKDDRTLSDLNPASCNIMDKPREHYASEISETQKQSPFTYRGKSEKVKRTEQQQKQHSNRVEWLFPGTEGWGKGMSVGGNPH